MLLNQQCIYYFNCSRTVDECKVCPLITHTEVDSHVQGLLQKQFDKAFNLVESNSVDEHVCDGRR